VVITFGGETATCRQYVGKCVSSNLDVEDTCIKTISGGIRFEIVKMSEAQNQKPSKQNDGRREQIACADIQNIGAKCGIRRRIVGYGLSDPIQFGAGGASAAAELKAEGTRDPSWAIAQAKRFLDAGAGIIMIESEGITENVDRWRTDVPARFIDEIGMEKLMFEAADPDVFEWYIKNYGADVNLFVDHSQIVQLECLRAGIWGTKSLWGRVVTYKDARQ